MEQLYVDNNQIIQDNFLGANAVYHGYTFAKDSCGREYSEEQCQLELDRVQDMGLQVARTFYSWYAWENGQWNWNNDNMKRLYRWIKELKKRNVNVALNVGWWLANDVFSDHTDQNAHGGTAPFFVEGDWNASVQKYAEWVSETVYQIVEVHGFTNLRYLVMFTEPNFSRWEMKGKTKNEAWFDCVKAVHEQLVKDKRRHLVKLVGPNEADKEGKMIKWAMEHANEYIDIYSNHWYLNYSFTPNDFSQVHSGKMAVMFSCPGYRVQQKVALKPSTEYEITMYAKIICDDDAEIQGDVLLGAFYAENGFISAGGQKLTNLTPNSVTFFNSAKMGNQWAKYTACFNSGNNTEGYIGVFHDVNPPVLGYYDDISLSKKGKSENLLNNSGFEDKSDTSWKIFREGLGGPEMDDYDVWLEWAHEGMKGLPEGKQYWFDEYNTKYDDHYTDALHGTRIATAQAAFMNAGMQTSLVWTLFDQQWPNNHTTNMDSFVDGDHRCGFMPTLRRSKVPYPAYYAFAILSKYLGGEGTKVFSGSGTNRIHIAMSQRASGEYSILVVNSDISEADIQINLKSAINRTLYRHLYNPATIQPTEVAVPIGIDATLENVENKFIDTLPAGGVAIYTSMK